MLLNVTHPILLYQLPIIFFLTLFLFTTRSSKPSIKPHTLIAAHTRTHTHTPHSSARNPHRRQSISHRPHSTPGYWTNGSNSTPTVIARITGCIGIEDDLCVKRKRQREKRPGDRRMEKQMARERKEGWNREMTGPDWQEAPAEWTRESASHCSHMALLSCQHPWCPI